MKVVEVGGYLKSLKCLDSLVPNSETLVKTLMRSKGNNVVVENIGDSSIKKSILLQTLQSHVSTANITESTLEALEGMEELHLCDGSTLTPSIRPAYCAVALECTLKYLQSEISVQNNPLYVNAVQRIWRDRVRYLESGGSLLYSSDLKQWRNQLEASLIDNKLGMELAELTTRRNAIRDIKDYLAKAWSDLGPSFIQLLTQPSNKEQAHRVTDTGGPSIPTNQGATPPPNQHNLLASASIEVEKVTGGPSIPTNQGATPPPNQHNFLASASIEVEKVTNTGGPSIPTNHGATPPPNQHNLLASASIAVQKVTDTGGPSIPTNQGATPPPNQHNLLAFASIEVQNDTTTAIVVEEMGPPKTCTKLGTSGKEMDLPKTCGEVDSLPSRPQIQEETLVKDPPESRFHLPNPKRKIVSPLKKYQPVNITKRRKPKKWSVLEEYTLKSAVKEIGEGNWKVILNSNLDIFSERTPTDLKDKWRNMARCGDI